MTDRTARITAAVAALEALLLLGYAVSIAVVAITQGIQGPTDVSSPVGVVVEVVTFALLGVGVAAVAVGRWRRSDWAGVPFGLIQALALTVGIPLATGSGGGVPVGIVITVAAVVGAAAAVAGRVTARSALDLREPTAAPAAPRSERGTR